MGQKTCRKQRSKMKRRSTKTQKATRRKRRQKILRKNWTWWVLLSFHYTPCESQGMSCTENPATGKDLLPHTPGACQKKCCARLIPKMRGWVWCNSATSGTEHYLPKKDPFPRWNHCHRYFLTTCTASQDQRERQNHSIELQRFQGWEHFSALNTGSFLPQTNCSGLQEIHVFLLAPHWPAGCSWKCCFLSTHSSFPIWNMRVIMLTSFWDCCESSSEESSAIYGLDGISKLRQHQNKTFYSFLHSPTTFPRAAQQQVNISQPILSFGM